MCQLSRQRRIWFTHSGYALVSVTAYHSFGGEVEASEERYRVYFPTIPCSGCQLTDKRTSVVTRQPDRANISLQGLASVECHRSASQNTRRKAASSRTATKAPRLTRGLSFEAGFRDGR
jgi:hypothetical protein